MRITQKPHAPISEIINNSEQSITKKTSSFATSIGELTNSLETIKSQNKKPQKIIKGESLSLCDEFEKNYKIGDLIYGMHEQRVKYMNDYKFNEKQYSTGLTIDKYNAELEKKCYGIILSDAFEIIIDSMREPQKSDVEIENAKNLLSNNFKELFTKDIKKPLTNPKVQYHHMDTYLSLEENNKYSSANLYKKHIYNQEGYLYFDNRFNKMKCKSGLEMAVIDPKVVIHFLLDGIDMDRVIDKIRGITGSELRFAYRNKERLAGKIFFYEKGKQVAPPWEQDPTLWDNYKPKSDQQNVA